MSYLIDKGGKVLRVRVFAREGDTAVVAVHEHHQPPDWHQFEPVDEVSLEPWDYGEQALD